MQVEARQRTFPSLGLSVVSLATWRLEAAALIETHPSPATSLSASLFLSKLPLSSQTERRRKTVGESTHRA